MKSKMNDFNTSHTLLRTDLMNCKVNKAIFIMQLKINAEQVSFGLQTLPKQQQMQYAAFQGHALYVSQIKF